MDNFSRQPLPPMGGPQPGPQLGAQPGGIQSLPPEIAQHIDQNNPMQMTLLKRVFSLAPEEGEALIASLNPQAIVALKKIIPELGFLIDMIQHEGGGMPQPTSALGSI